MTSSSLGILRRTVGHLHECMDIEALPERRHKRGVGPLRGIRSCGPATDGYESPHRPGAGHDVVPADLHLSPQRLEYVVHVAGWPRPLRYAPFVDAYAPPAARVLGLRQEVVHLTPQEVGIKTSAIQAHASELLPFATLVAFARRTEVFLAPADLTDRTDAVRTAQFFFPINRVGDEDRPVIQTFSVTDGAGGLQLSLKMGRVLNRLEEMELFLFPVSTTGGFGSAPKLHVIYRGGAATAEVSDLEHPTAKPVTATVIHDGTTISLTFDDTSVSYTHLRAHETRHDLV